MNERRFLGAVFALGLDGKATLRRVAGALGVGLADARQESETLSAGGLVLKAKGGMRLTERGRRRLKVVFIGGGFEIIHPGHLHTIEEAKKLGDVLVAVAASDATIRRRKGRDPVAPGKERVRLLSALRQVDVAILGVDGDIYETLGRVGPDVVALGYDQHHLEHEIEREGRKRGMELRVVRLGSSNASVKTSRILGET